MQKVSKYTKCYATNFFYYTSFVVCIKSTCKICIICYVVLTLDYPNIRQIFLNAETLSVFRFIFLS